MKDNLNISNTDVLDALEPTIEEKIAFEEVFNSPSGKMVLNYLCKFTVGNLGDFQCNPNLMYYLEGMRRVFALIVSYTELPTDYVMQLFKATNNLGEGEIDNEL
ncbi:MAG: hypothetical protein LBJ80_00080 [Rickettsiales bacterium]|nr:hypothetical protein [Rickettsiales bacterium]